MIWAIHTIEKDFDVVEPGLAKLAQAPLQGRGWNEIGRFFFLANTVVMMHQFEV